MEELMETVINTVVEHPGIKITQFEKYINMKSSKIKACVKYLLVNGDIYVEDKQYYKMPRIWKPDLEKRQRK